MYLAQGAIISMDLGKGHIKGENTSDKLKEEIRETISHFFKKFIVKNNLKFIDCTPYNEIFLFNGEELKSRVEKANLSKSSLHITLNIDFSKENEILCSVNEFDSRGRKFAENICSSFEVINYKNKGIKNAEVYNLLYVNKPSIIINLNLDVGDEIDIIEKCSFIAQTLVDSILTLGTK
ncbi:hypothetical protein [Clostridium sp. LIBA-8841]|uniref:hypothetical protein n=1 Tax=Clostridium sp. LIBA-8841 TaxID=2987530 RepID=UPI002AC4AFA2|nr:hypothetical protein [Clostridium sp. LIBA-8841]MDZ5252371.1 hypothetical protein [Clostridium sp. LIBA-8841]